MNLSQWVKALWGSSLRKSPQRTHSRCKSPLLSLEALEDRWVPSVVTNLNDSGAGSLRDAIVSSTADGGTVTFQAGLTGTITLTSGAIAIAKNLTINGPGASSLAVDGNANGAVFIVNSGETDTISGLTIQNGNVVGDGGGIFNNGTLTLQSDTITKNTAAGDGGGIANAGTLTVTNTSIDSNTASGSGGGIGIDAGTVVITGSTISNSKASVSGGIAVNNAALTLINSTVSGNQATSTTNATAGGLAEYTFSNLGNASVTLTQDTFANNTAAGAGNAKDVGVFQSGTGVASATLGNTILGSTATTNPNAVTAGGGTITSNGNNLSFDGTGAATATDLKGDPLLGPLQNNGGPTLTMLPASNSPVINAGNNALAVDQNGNGLTTDQTGGTRIINTTVDIGADELGQNGVLAFSAATYSITEGTTSTLTVTRTGNTTGTVSVIYSVSLPSNLAAKFLANLRGDVVGTLIFTPGDTQRTFTSTVPNDNGVEENDVFDVTLSQATGGAALGSPAETTVTDLNIDLPSVPNATPVFAVLQRAGLGIATSLENYQHFVLNAYLTYLNRTPSTTEVAYWVNLMQEYETNHSTGLRQQDVEAGFLDSAEYFSRSGGTANKTWIDSIYHNLLGRAPDANGEAYWLAQLAAGVSPQIVALGFTASQERLSDRVVATYETLLGRAPEASGLAYWINVFNAGGTTEDIDAGIVGSFEYYNKPNGPLGGGAAGNPAEWIREAYLDILGRPAQVSEFPYWLNFLNQPS